MRKLFITGLFSVFCVLILFAQGKVNPNYHYVKGHYRNGTYIQGHYRTNPNSTNRDNYSTRGNTNPHTLQPGWIQPDNNPLPSYSVPSYTPSTYTRSDYFPASNFNTTPSNSSFDGLLNNLRYTNNYTEPSYPSSTYSYYTVDLSAGERIIEYRNGRDEFNVATPAKIAFKKNLIYYSFDPYENEIKETVGGAEGKLLLNGPYRFYDSDGVLRIAEHYRKGLKHGKSTVYDTDGNVLSKEEYNYGKLVYQKFADEDGIVFEVFGELFQPGTRMNLYKNGALFKKIETIRLNYDKHTQYDLHTQNKLIEYSLLDDELHGTLRQYQSDGQTLAEVANYKNGLRNGETRLYNLNGKVSEKFNYVDDVKNGPFEIYNENGTLSMKGSLVNGLPHGQVINYNALGKLDFIAGYDNGKKEGIYKAYDNGKLMVSGKHSNGEPDGRWDYYWKDSSNYYPVQWVTFQNGTRHGPFREIRHDSVLVGTYKNGNLEGDFKAYQPLTLWIFGTPPKNLDEDEILCSGRYRDGLKTGHWKFHSRTGVLLYEGDYWNDLKHGEWRYYLERFAMPNGEDVPYAGQLYKIENFLNGKLSGRTERLAYLYQTPVMCDTSIGTVNPLDTCFQLEYHKVHEITYYKNDELHGPIEWRNAEGQIVKKGEYRNGQRQGRWLEIQNAPLDSTKVYRIEGNFEADELNGYYNKYDNANDALLVSGNFINDQKDGIWKEFFPGTKRVSALTHYKDGQKTSMKYYNYDGELYLNASYRDGFMTRIEKMDTVQNRLKSRFDIQSFDQGTYVLNFTVFADSVYTFQVRYSPGYREPESDPFFFVGTFSFLKEASPDAVQFDGPSGLTDKNGRILAEGAFSNNRLQGEWRYYYHEQNILRLVQYENGAIVEERYHRLDSHKPYSGKFTVRTPQEGGYLVIKIKKGLRHGPTLQYNQNGQLVKKIKYKEGKKVDSGND